MALAILRPVDGDVVGPCEFDMGYGFLLLERVGNGAAGKARVVFRIIIKGKGNDKSSQGQSGRTGYVSDKRVVAMGCDEAGFALKNIIAEHLKDMGVEVVDYGCHSTDPVDYPDVAEKLARDIAAHKSDRGVLICGTGIGMAIAANKVPGVYAAQAHDTFSAERARKSNNAQVITLGARVIGPELAKQIITAWMNSEFAGGGSARKVEKICKIERGEGD